jgi:hypothetical protein
MQKTVQIVHGENCGNEYENRQLKFRRGEPGKHLTNRNRLID